MILLLAQHWMGKIEKDLHQKHPNNIGQMVVPSQNKLNPIGLYAIDNGCYKQFNEDKFRKMLVEAKKYHPPLFIVCPDVVGCHERTYALWQYYQPYLKQYGYPIAFVAQDGCEPRDVPDIADWIFIGGHKDTKWKEENVHKYIGDRPVHVGRVNGIGMLEYCERIGVTSVDGSGWLKGKKTDKQFNDFIQWFKGDEQMKLWDNLSA